MNHLLDLSLFLNHGFSLQDSLKMLQDEDNEKIIEDILCQQEQGISIKESMMKFIPIQIKNLLDNFYRFLPFSQALKGTVELVYHQKQIKKQLIKPLIYPLWLVFISLSVLIYFYFIGIDQMSRLVFDLYQHDQTLLMMKGFLGVLLFTIGICIVIVIGGYIWISHKQNKILLYIVLSKYCPIPLLTKWCTYRFILYYKYCVSAGLKSKDTLDLLSTFEDEMVVFLTYHTKQLLENGENFKTALSNPYLDRKLKRFIHLANISQQLEIMLSTYLEQLEANFMVFFRKLSALFQGLSYTFIGIMIIICYQILLLPIQMIEGI